ncbi:hypothetical protein DIU36_24275 [Mucilaginibacter rubeus]|nr:hypothetical protein DIU36_24275 [Mucilaginibacter rubeus]
MHCEQDFWFRPVIKIIPSEYQYKLIPVLLQADVNRLFAFDIHKLAGAALRSYLPGCFVGKK